MKLGEVFSIREVTFFNKDSQNDQKDPVQDYGIHRDFPGGPVVNMPANAGDTGSVFGPGRFRLPWRQPNPCASTTESLHPRSCAPQQEKPSQWETQAPQLESSLHSLQLGKAHTQQRKTSTVRKQNKCIH